MAGKARLVWENWTAPEQSSTDTEDKATVKSLYVPLVPCTGSTTKLPWYLAVSTPPKRIEPVKESIRRQWICSVLVQTVHTEIVEP